MRILIVDDDPVSQRLLSRALQNAGHVTELAGDGQEAWERIQHEHFPVLIIDWMMPRLDGPGLIRKLRAHSFPSYVYAILLTSRHERDDRVGGLESGADDFLTKPVDLRELRARLAVAERILHLELQLREVNSRLNYQATHDPLTELLNRPAITECAEVELARSKRTGRSMSFALFDLDHFKAINDEHGHLAGDEVLRHTAICIRSAVRAYDRVGRWGGEEFLVVLPETQLEQAALVAERIRARLAASPLTLPSGLRIELSASAGVSCDQRRADVSLDALFHEADEALYMAKAAGRNNVARATY